MTLPSHGWPLHECRAEHVAMSPADRFIVSLLRGWIEQAIRDAGCGRLPFRPLLEESGAGTSGST